MHTSTHAQWVFKFSGSASVSFNKITENEEQSMCRHDCFSVNVLMGLHRTLQWIINKHESRSPAQHQKCEDLLWCPRKMFSHHLMMMFFRCSTESATARTHAHRTDIHTVMLKWMDVMLYGGCLQHYKVADLARESPLNKHKLKCKEHIMAQKCMNSFKVVTQCQESSTHHTDFI